MSENQAPAETRETMSDDAKYLDECLRLRGGVSPEPDDDRAVRNVLDELTATRRALADVTRERNEAIVMLSLCKIGREQAQSDLATARAALEDVRRVEEWLHEDHGSTRKLATNGEGRLSLLDTYAQSEWRAYSIEALGRALAQEAGHEAK